MADAGLKKIGAAVESFHGWGALGGWELKTGVA